jgi:hypothetical protein
VGVRPASLAGAAESSVARVWPRVARLSPGALGLALVLLVSVAWGTGLFYLVARLGAASPVRLATLDGVHVYVGVVGGVFVAAKVLRVGLRHRVDGVPNAVPWQRWLSWSMLVLYGVVFASGVLALLPIRGRPYGALVQVHLLSSIWAVAPTTWHVWHYRARALPYVRRAASRLPVRRFWLGLALVVLPVPALLADAPAVSQLPRVLGGSTWSPAALNGSYLDTVALAPDGTLVAAGDALYLSHDGVVWLRVDLPAGAAPAPASGAGQPAGHQHGQPAPANPITALAVGPGQVFAGTSGGLFAGGLDGPLRQVAFAGGGVRALALDPADPRTLWVASTSGPMLSADGGQTWSREGVGLGRPAAAAAVAYLGGRAFLSDTTGVFTWRSSTRSWERTSSAPSVTELDASPATGALYASATDDLRVLAAGRWTDLGQPVQVHVHHGEVHGGTPVVTSVDGRLYAAGTADGVSASSDGGWTWTQLAGGLADTAPGQVVAYRGSLWSATSNGLYRYPLAIPAAASPGWWLLVLAGAAVLGLIAVGVAGPDLRRRRR